MIDWQLAAAIPNSAGGVAYFAYADEVDALPAGISATLARAQGFVAKPGTTMFANDGDRLIVIVGLGARPGDDGDGDEAVGVELGAAAKRWLAAGASAARALRSTPEVAIVLTPGLSQSAHGQVVEGFELGSYEFAVHRSSVDDTAMTTELVHVVGIDRRVMDRAIKVARSVNFARDLANETPNRMTAAHLVAIAQEIAADSLLSFAMADKDALVAGGFGCLLAVNAGSVEPPAMITLGYSPSPTTDATPHVVLVGKGITFDSGGLSLKQPAHMYDMKGDMGGAAAVFAVVRVAQALELHVRVTAIVAATDNLPGPSATKPGEVVTARNGTTVEILDTDAEGRLA